MYVQYMGEHADEGDIKFLELKILTYCSYRRLIVDTKHSQLLISEVFMMGDGEY